MIGFSKGSGFGLKGFSASSGLDQLKDVAIDAAKDAAVDKAKDMTGNMIRETLSSMPITTESNLNQSQRVTRTTYLFGLINKETVELVIKLTLHEIHVDFMMPVEMTILVERGKQRGETKRFPIGPNLPNFEFNSTAEYSALFDYDPKKNVWSEKDCFISLGYFNQQNRW